MFDQVRVALLRRDLLTAGQQALAVRAPAPADGLFAAELARLDRKLDATDAERRRLVDLYQAGLLELPDLQRRATDVERLDLLIHGGQEGQPKRPCAASIRVWLRDPVP